MTDHLPECDSAFTDLHTANCVCRCICPELRACEQRVNSSNLTMWNRTKEEAQHMIDAGLGIRWKDGFKEGLDAAREAVHRMDWMYDEGCANHVVQVDDALAAIAAAEQRGHRFADVENYKQGQRDMLAKCIAAVEEWALENPYEHPSPNRIIAALRALQEKP